MMEPDSRLTCAELLEHKYFDGFRARFEPELQALMSKNQDQHQAKSKKQKVEQYCRQMSVPTGVAEACSTTIQKINNTKEDFCLKRHLDKF